MKKHDKKDIKYLGVPNVCFSLTKEDDAREEQFSKQRIERGFDDSETWSFRDTAANFMIPRLKRYQEIANDFLARDEELVKDVDDVIEALELIVRDDGICIWNDEEKVKVEEGLMKFPEVFMSLWW